ncbi:MAG: hypothetical protein ACKOBG_11955 [Actinomycetota bacterium]
MAGCDRCWCGQPGVNKLWFCARAQCRSVRRCSGVMRVRRSRRVFGLVVVCSGLFVGAPMAGASQAAGSGAANAQGGGVGPAPAISAGDDHSCGLLANGSARCWGSNGYGPLGNGTTTNSSVPVTVPGV